LGFAFHKIGISVHSLIALFFPVICPHAESIIFTAGLVLILFLLLSMPSILISLQEKDHDSISVHLS